MLILVKQVSKASKEAQLVMAWSWVRRDTGAAPNPHPHPNPNPDPHPNPDRHPDPDPDPNPDLVLGEARHGGQHAEAIAREQDDVVRVAAHGGQLGVGDVLQDARCKK